MVLSPRSRHDRADGDAGLVLITFALALTALLILAALVIDLGDARQMSRQAQASSDAAALAGAPYLPISTPSSNAYVASAKAEASAYAASNILGTTTAPTPTSCAGDEPANSTCYAVGGATITVATPYVPLAPSYAFIYVEVCRPTEAVFSRVIGAKNTDVCRSAVARRAEAAPGTGIGLIALSTAGCNITLNGTNGIIISGGAVVSNSEGTPAICAQGNGCGTWEIDALTVQAPGTIDCQENMGDAAIGEGAPPVDDPYVEVPDTPCSTITPSGTAVTPPLNCSSGLPTSIGNCAAMSPGRYPGGCGFNGNGTVTLTPGVYWFEGNLDIGNRDLACPTCTPDNGVLLYFHTGTFAGGGNGKVNLGPYRPHEAGDPFAGLTIYQRRTNTTAMTFGGTTGQATGSIYAKNAPLTLRGTADRTVAGLIVAFSADMRGTALTTVVPPDNAPTTEPVSDIGLEL